MKTSLGLLLFLLAFPLLWWNESLAARESDDLGAGKKSVLSVSADKIDPAHEGRLLHLSGKATASKKIVDDFTHFEVQALRLHRKVEIYHWQESRRARADEKRKESYEYRLTWSPTDINSSTFRNPGHENKLVLPCAEATFEAPEAHLGAFNLVSSLAHFKEFEPIAVEEGPHWPAGFTARAAEGLYRGRDPAHPQMGDVRITYEIVPEGEYTLVGQQSAGGLAVGANDVFVVRRGLAPAGEVFSQLESQAAFSLWFVRGLGFCLMAGGIFLVIKPMAALKPFTAGSVTVEVPVVAALAAFPCTLVGVGLGWLAARPLMALLLIGVAVAALVALARKFKPV